MTQYVTVPTVRAYLGADLPDDDTLISALIDRAQAYIENETQRHFVQSTGVSHSYSVYYPGFAGGGEGLGRAPYILHLDDDLIAVTTLTNGDGTAIPSSGYWLEPVNLGPPYGSIRLKTNPTSVFIHNTDQSVIVTGTWGWSATPPADIVHATIRLVGYYYAQRGAPIYDVTAEPGAGVITVPQGVPKDVALIIDNYRRRFYW